MSAANSHCQQPGDLTLRLRVGGAGSITCRCLADKADMRALSIRQPYAELILRGPAVSRIKPIEFRSRPTKIIGERFHIYASRQWAAGKLHLGRD